jgi:16S rRNA (cytosine967-C5)-methyltransferase
VGCLLRCRRKNTGIDRLQENEYKNVSINCTDIRLPILKNLKERIMKTGFTKFKNQHIDAADVQWPDGVLFDKIIVDAPCSGSGTWGRNPENLLQFDSLQLPIFSQKQFDILSNCLQFLNKNGLLYYITCSVFADENEGVINKIDKEKYIVLFSKYIAGSDDGADTLYIAAIKKYKKNLHLLLMQVLL